MNYQVQQSDIDHLAITLNKASCEHTSRRFWTKLLESFDAYIAGLNDSVSPLGLALTSNLFSASIAYLEYDLFLFMDIRIGEISYFFRSQRLSGFDSQNNGVTLRGTITLDSSSGVFRVRSSPEIYLGGDAPFAGAHWPEYDRVAQYLLQQLVKPGLRDERFLVPQA